MSRRRIQTAMLVALSLIVLAATSTIRAESLSYQLSQSTPGLQLWTTPPIERVFKDSVIPGDVGDSVRLFAASNETEPFQVVVRPSVSGPVTVTGPSFAGGITTELYQVMYVPVTIASDNLGRTGDYPDPLWPLPSPATVTLVAGENTSFWFSVYVPRGTAAGDYNASVQIGSISVPITLHVFDFAIPDALHVDSELGVDYNAIMNAYSVSNYFPYVELINKFMIRHRLTPSVPTWPGTLTYNGGAPAITYDCAGTLTDTDGIWGFEIPAAKYIGGNGFNDGTGFPRFRAANNSIPPASSDQRPNNFCSQSRSSLDWFVANNPGTPYNINWRTYVEGMRNYLAALGHLPKAYWRISNEPFSSDDYNAAAWYSQLLKSAAPELSLMVAKEPRPEIYANALYPGAKIDLWLTLLDRFDPGVSWERERLHAESSWLYFLAGTRTPRFNPITLDHPGVDARLLGWFAWKFRLRGVAHESVNNWGINPWTTPYASGQNGDQFLIYPPSKSNVPIPNGSNGDRLVPSIRLELIREGFEDYEYLYRLVGGVPLAGTTNGADALADRVVGGLTAYNRNSEYFYELRRQIGLYLGGETSQFPDVVPPAEHPRASELPSNYYINFQNPAGAPFDTPLIVDGKSYMKIGWQPYSKSLGYGWYGDFSQALYSYLPAAPNELQRSVIYDDFGRIKTFEFDLPNATYEVTVSVGWQGRTDQHNKVVVEGVPLINDETSSPYLVKTATVTIKDHKLSLEMGKPLEYTMLNYLDIVVIDSDSDGVPDSYEAVHQCLDTYVVDAALDPDLDGLTTVDEYSRGTDPCRSDSDGGGDNDGSEALHNRSPFDAADDQSLTLMVRRSGDDIVLDWNRDYGVNATISGPYFIYRSSTLPLSSADLLTGPIDTGIQQSIDPSPPGAVLFYSVVNTRLP
ncbi:MAG: DUF4091 domain-containing protein [Acidobacteriota bacterium]